MDFAYWASAYVLQGNLQNDGEYGQDTDSAPAISWAADQVGVEVPTTYEELTALLIHVDASDAIRTRGALLIADSRIAVCLSVSMVVDLINGNYVIRRIESLSEEAIWNYGGLLPGIDY